MLPAMIQIPHGWSLASPNIQQHIAMLEQHGATIYNWLDDPRVPALLAAAIDGGTRVEMVKVDNPDAWNRFSVARRTGPAIDALDAVRKEYVDRLIDWAWTPEAKHPRAVLESSLQFANLCPTGEALVNWALDELERKAKAA